MTEELESPKLYAATCPVCRRVIAEITEHSSAFCPACRLWIDAPEPKTARRIGKRQASSIGAAAA